MSRIYGFFCIIAIVVTISCNKNEQGSEKKVESSDRYISSRNGLKMRENPNESGKQIALIPEGEKVILIEESGSDINLAGVSGKWSKIKWQEKTGWVFGGFLSNNAVLNSEILEEHFLDVAVDSSSGSDQGCSALKIVNSDSLHGDGGNCEKESSIIKDTTVVKNGNIYFKRQDESGEDCRGECPEPECDSKRTEVFECYIDGSEIMKTKKNETFKGPYKCNLISTKKVSNSAD